MKNYAIIDVHIHSSAGSIPENLDKLRDEFGRNGVALGLLNSLGVNGWPQFPNEKEVRAANEEACALAERSGGILGWLAYLNPQNANWRAEMDRCRAAGAAGLKLWVALKDKRGNTANAERVMEYAGRCGLPILVHTFNRTDESLPGEVNAGELMELAERHPRTNIIVAHAGIHWPSELELFRPRPNVWVECGGGYPIKGQAEALVRKMGPERVLFGSDLFCRSQASQLVKVILADLPEAHKKKILSENAIKLFGLRELLKPVKQTIACYRIPDNAKIPGSTTPATGKIPVFPTVAGRVEAGLDFSNTPSRTNPCPVDTTEDHFCFCGRWPFFNTDCPTPARLETLLAKNKIRRAYAADLGSVYRQDLLPANAAFLSACRNLRRVRPLAVVNPRIADWKETLAKLPGRFAGAIVFPHLHNWSLSDPRFALLMRKCRKLGMPLWVNCRLDDVRFRHPGMAYHGVTTEELLAAGAAADAPPIVFQGVMEGSIDEFLKRYGKNNRFRFTLTHLTDYPGALRRIIEKHGAKRLVMGSEHPFRDIRQVGWTSRRV